MNKDQVKGRVEEAKGKRQGNDRQGASATRTCEAEGTVDKAAGKVQKTYGDAKEKVKDAIDKI